MRRVVVFAAGMLCAGAGAITAQEPFTDVIAGVKTGGSKNITLLAHLPLDSIEKTADITVEQELSRPYVYTAHRLQPSGVDIISIKDPSKPRLIWSWRIENAALHKGAGALNPMYLKSKGRYYLTNAFQFASGGPDRDLGAVVWDITGLPDTSTIREIARIRETEYPGGFHESYTYRHSAGLALLFTTVNGPWANIYDIDKVAGGGDSTTWRVGRVPIPGDSAQRGFYHDFYVAFDPATKQDKFYGAGAGGYYIYDVTKVRDPKLITSITGVAGVQWGHTFMADPTGRYVVTEAEYQYAPLRLFDLKPGLDGTVKTISRPVGAWTADWRNLSHNFEIRWPYVFVSAYEDGLQVFNMMDPANPYTVGYYYTCECPHGKGAGYSAQNPQSQSIFSGAWGVQVRNADGLIVISDLTTGFWSFRMEGFDGWNGHQWGVPNMSSAQDWDNGPEGAPKPVS